MAAALATREDSVDRLNLDIVDVVHRCLRTAYEDVWRLTAQSPLGASYEGLDACWNILLNMPEPLIGSTARKI